MNYIKFLSFVSIFCISSIVAEGLGIGLGPFYLSLGTGTNVYPSNRMGMLNDSNRMAKLDDPICFAIMNQKRIELVAQGEEIISPNEKRLITKKVTVEPYAFGFSRDRSPLLQGNIVEEKLVREVSFKFGEDRFAQEKNLADQQILADQQKGGLPGILHSKDKLSPVDISSVSDIGVINDSHFDFPKEITQIDDFTQIICRVPTAKSL